MMNADSEVKVHQGRNVRFFRNARNMKQEDFADRIGVKQPAVTRIERQSVIEAPMLLKCAEVLGISVDMLKEFEPEKMFDSFTYNIDKVENSNGWMFSQKDSTNTNHNYPLEKLMELNNKNAELYERLLQAEKEKNELLEKLMDAKMATEQKLI